MIVAGLASDESLRVKICMSEMSFLERTPVRGRVLPILQGGLIVLLVVLAYLPALNGKFIWDDDSWTTGISNLLRDFPGLLAMWIHPTALQQYYPLTGTSFWIDYHLWGFWTLPYHVENVLLHALAALLFWQLLRRFGVPGARLAAVLFAFHPLMVESVAWITERKNVLSLVLYLGSLLAYTRYAPSVAGDAYQLTRTGARLSHATRHASFFYWLALILFIGALLAKTTAFSLPAVILLLAWWKRGRLQWQADVLPTLPFFVIALGLCTLTAWLEKNHVGAYGPEFALSTTQRCLIAGRVFWFYLGKLFWPAGLYFVYPRWHPNPEVWRQWLYPMAAVGILLALWLGRKRIGRGPLVAMLFFAGTLFPVLGFMNAYFMRYSFVCDHWVYLSSLGPIALGAALVTLMAGRFRTPGVLYGFAAVALPLLLLLTWRQAGMYINLETLWRTTIAKSPDAFLAEYNLGYMLEKDGRISEAMNYYRKAIQNGDPDSFKALDNLGIALAAQGQLDKAIECFHKAIQFGGPTCYKTLNNLGVALAAQGHVDEAVENYRKSIQLNPNYFESQYNLGFVLAAQGRWNEAVEHYRQAIRIKPGDAEAHFDLGIALAKSGQLKEAAVQYHEATALDPTLKPAP